MKRIVLAIGWPLLVGGLFAAFSWRWLPNAWGVGLTALFTFAAVLGGFQLAKKPPPPPAPYVPPPPELCPKCGSGIDDLEKDTSSGRELHYLSCSAHCGWHESRDYGVALWVAMSAGSERGDR